MEDDRKEQNHCLIVFLSIGEGVGSLRSTLSVMRHVGVGDEAVVHRVEILRITPAKLQRQRSYRDGGRRVYTIWIRRERSVCTVVCSPNKNAVIALRTWPQIGVVACVLLAV